ncbi:MAG TPA: Hpt domain-containing protein, partial [Burkholderiales bacterium]|nr:Hpt domain-containing protein [Burkholderiales bacterium]
TLTEMAATHSRGDLPALGKLGHKLKSSARTVGALGFADLCQSLEGAAAANNAQQAARTLSELPPLMDMITRQVEHELGELRR